MGIDGNILLLLDKYHIKISKHLTYIIKCKIENNYINIVNNIMDDLYYIVDKQQNIIILSYH